MIPRHSLPFSTGKLFSILIASAPAPTPSDLEKAFADELRVREVVLMPSVRAGIDMLIRAFNGQGVTAIGPVYTCGTVHEALARSAAPVRLIDSAPGSFLMQPEDISAACGQSCAVVLSEIYGIPYDLEKLGPSGEKGAVLRIFDMAMCIPLPDRLRQLGDGDAALFSFGWGKPMYAGWGGIACFTDPQLAGRLRENLAELSSPETPALRLERAFALSLRTVVNQRMVYGISHEPHLYRALRRTYYSRGNTFCQADRSGGGLPHQWTRPMTALNRRLALQNLRSASQNAGIRRDQAEIYQISLEKTGSLTDQDGRGLPQSHFPIRVPASIRDKLCDYLRSRGIDTCILFPFPPGLSRNAYPRAAEAADEVIALPLGPSMKQGDAKAVSKHVEEGLRTLA